MTRWLPRRTAARAAPLIARLFDSVAPDVNTISLASAPIARATCSSSMLDRLGRLPAKPMRDARRIAVNLCEIRNHGLDDPGIGPRRRVIVEVDRIGPHAISPVPRTPRQPRLRAFRSRMNEEPEHPRKDLRRGLPVFQHAT